MLYRGVSRGRDGEREMRRRLSVKFAADVDGAPEEGEA